MAQQINLCSPILLTQKKYFSASTMAVSLGVFIVLGGVLAGVWSWNLSSAASQYTVTMEAQARDIASLQAALERNKAAALPVDAGLTQQLDTRKAQLAQRKALLAALQEGASEPGKTYSERLRFLASSTPAPVWVTGVTLSPGVFQVAGFTLEPSALNEWVARMATNPLLQGLQLSQVQVQAVRPQARGASGAPQAAGAAGMANPAAAGRNVWAFELGSTRPMAPARSAEQERKP